MKRIQRGQIQKYGVNWVLRYRAVVDGKETRVREPLGPFSEHPFRRLDDASEQKLRILYEPKINQILHRINHGQTEAGSGNVTLQNFIEHSYFPRLDWRLTVDAKNDLHIEPSTVKGYKNIFDKYINGKKVSEIKLSAFTAVDARRFIEGLPQHLTHTTHLRILNFIRGVLTWAVLEQVITSNPFDNIKAGGVRGERVRNLTDREKKIQASNNHAYTVGEVAIMLDKLPDPARTVCAVAAFTGLTRSELRGLKWEDYDGEYLHVRRKVWNQHVGALKTDAREAKIYIVPMLREILAKYRTEFPPNEDGWIFRGDKLMRPLDLDNLSRQVITVHINGAWRGWHAFRRGLGTRLYEINVKDKEIQEILRHANVSTTLAYYIRPDSERAVAGMKELANAVKSAYAVRI